MLKAPPGQTCAATDCKLLAVPMRLAAGHAAVVSPPSKVRTSPVMYDESLFEAKKT